MLAFLAVEVSIFVQHDLFTVSFHIYISLTSISRVQFLVASCPWFKVLMNITTTFKMVLMTR